MLSGEEAISGGRLSDGKLFVQSFCQNELEALAMESLYMDTKQHLENHFKSISSQVNGSIEKNQLEVHYDPWKCYGIAIDSMNVIYS